MAEVKKNEILVTGGCGYIGSHTVVELLNAGYKVIIVDSLVNSSEECLKRITHLTSKTAVFYKGDVTCPNLLNGIFSKHKIDAVIHFAGYKCVGESVQEPLLYYTNNLQASINLIKIMAAHEVFELVFSSSCTVYGDPETLPVTEMHPTGRTTNPYGFTKFAIEQMLQDVARADKRWRITSLRYFNPVGAHPSGLLGEDPRGIPNNLMPYVAQVAVGRRDKLLVYGGDYNTQDGTGVRDYIHVLELSQGHVLALMKITQGFQAFNLGTGHGYSVLELVEAFKEACGKDIPHEIVGRREGDVAVMFCDSSKAKAQLNWTATRDIRDMCMDMWRFQQKNPNGYCHFTKINGNCLTQQ